MSHLRQTLMLAGNSKLLPILFCGILSMSFVFQQSELMRLSMASTLDRTAAMTYIFNDNTNFSRNRTTQRAYHRPAYSSLVPILLTPQSRKI